MRILLMHGPTLELLGSGRSERFGSRPLEDIERMVRGRAGQRQARLETYQSNHEGGLLDLLIAEAPHLHGVILNPGPLAHTSYALRDAIAAVRPPVVEVHLHDLAAEEDPARRRSLLAGVCALSVHGRGLAGYLAATDRLLDRLGAPPAFGAGG